MCCRRQGPVRRPRASRAQLLPVHRGVHPLRGLQDQERVRPTRGSDPVRYFHLNTPHLHILGCKYWATLMESSTLPQRLAAGKFKNFPCKVVILRRYNRLHSSLAIVSFKQEYKSGANSCSSAILLNWPWSWHLKYTLTDIGVFALLTWQKEGINICQPHVFP